MKNLVIVLCLMLFSLMGYGQNGNIKSVIQSAENGNAQSQYLLGWSYGNGKNGLLKNERKAVVWLDKSARQGYEAAQYYLGWCYYYGFGVDKNYKKAIEWYQKAAKQGNVEAASMVKVLSSQWYSTNEVQYNTAKKTAVDKTKFDPSNPPSIEIISNSVQFVDPNGNNAIDANEKCRISFKIKNVGRGTAYDCKASIFAAEPVKGLTLGKVNIPILMANEERLIEIPVNSSIDTEDKNTNLYVKVDEPNGFGTDPLQLSINTKKFEAPMLKVVDYTATSNAGDVSVLKKKVPFDMQILLQNVAHGSADDVLVSLVLPDNVVLMEEEKNNERFTTVKGGEVKSLVYPLVVNNKYSDTKIPIQIRVKEKYGQYAEDKTIELNLEQALATNKLTFQEKEQSKQQSFNIKIASIGSDIDKGIPITESVNDNTFAVIIANETYSKEAGVPFAASDGRIFAEYCKQTLGLPENNIHLAINATLNDIRHEINWLNGVISAYNGKAKVVFYYAGHGIPDEKKNTAYLLPVDGYGSDVATGYALNDLYTALGELPSQSVMVFLDACFSGAKREGDMLASARSVAIKVDAGAPVGNMIVFSACQGDETAFPYKEQGHGMFTYYLLKKIQETKGDISLEDLGTYVVDKVRQKSMVENGKMQTPTLIPSEQLNDDWKVWKLK